MAPHSSLHHKNLGVRRPGQPGRFENREAREPFRVKPHDFGFDPKLDLDKPHRLIDDLEALEALKHLGS